MVQDRPVPNMLTGYGYTLGCTGCRQKRAGFATTWDRSEACKKQINSNSSRRVRQFQERVRQSAVRLNACSEQVTTQEEITPEVQLLQTQRKHLLTVHAGDHIFDHKKMKSPVHRDESADLAEHIGVAWDDLTGRVLDCNEVGRHGVKNQCLSHNIRYLKDC